VKFELNSLTAGEGLSRVGVYDIGDGRLIREWVDPHHSEMTYARGITDLETFPIEMKVSNKQDKMTL
jgi:hypothetical protein